MLLKIFSRGKGSGNAPINYLLGNDYMSEGKLRAGARIVSGNPLVTQAMINSSNFARRYTAGVLSFEEAPDAISEADKQAIIQDFERAVFAGMEHDRYNVLWVEHTDKKDPKTGKPRLELNFLIPNTELYTGKRLQPYYHGQDGKYFRAWQTMTNNRFKLSDPDDVSHARLINPYDSNQSPKTSYKSLKTQIEAYLRFKLMSGKLKKREDVIKELESIPNLGLTVTRQSTKFISVTPADAQKPIRLKGFVFDEGFDFTNYQAKQIADPSNTMTPNAKKETIASKDERTKQAQVDFKGIYAHKAEQNAKKYHIGLDELGWVAKPIDIKPKPPEAEKPRYSSPRPRY